MNINEIEDNFFVDNIKESEKEFLTDAINIFYSKNENEENHLKYRKLPNESESKVGRWSKEEHLKFVDAIMKFGNNWKEVQSCIKTRSSSQARSHAQKFFLKVRRHMLTFDDIQSDQLNHIISEACNIEGELFKNNDQCEKWIDGFTEDEKRNFIKLIKSINLSTNEDKVKAGYIRKDIMASYEYDELLEKNSCKIFSIEKKKKTDLLSRKRRRNSASQAQYVNIYNITISPNSDFRINSNYFHNMDLNKSQTNPGINFNKLNQGSSFTQNSTNARIEGGDNSNFCFNINYQKLESTKDDIEFSKSKCFETEFCIKENGKSFFNDIEDKESDYC